VIAAGTTTATMTAPGGRWTRGETVESELQPMDHLVACYEKITPSCRGLNRERARHELDQHDPRTRFLTP
jgi:hypothetical protein